MMWRSERLSWARSPFHLDTSPHVFSDRSRRRIVNPALESRSLLAVILLVLMDPARLEDFAESGVEVCQECDKHEARDQVLRVQVKNAVDVDDIRVLHGALCDCESQGRR